MDLQAMSVDELDALKRQIETELARRVNNNLKPGDKVTYKYGYDGEHELTGTVLEVTESGKSAKVRLRSRYGAYTQLVRITSLRKA
ncbi:MAG: hypothetical protein KGL39_20830 [Patescibacteria group bacterium]|nr:hypothetical protein [Patescibacteria group bacterium]